MEYSKPSAKVICDSVSKSGDRLTTVEVKLHRYVLAELNTHRVFSRNSASSRAIPAKKIRAMVLNDPALPIWWGKNQAGMQAPEQLVGQELQDVQLEWLKARDAAVLYHNKLEGIGLHKQLVNRLLEPFLWHRVIISATDWNNFFSQRCHKDAQPEMKAAADAIFWARSNSVPEPIPHTGPRWTRDWHLPYITDEDWLSGIGEEGLKKISVARCARVSYLTHDGKRDLQEDINLFNKLAGQKPGHWSPLEHVARPVKYTYKRGNFNGWWQFRHDVEGITQ